MTTSTDKAKKTLTADAYECEATYDVVVYGGDPEAVAAAAAAARRGSKVALVNPDPELGKLITRGWLTYLDIPPVAGEVKKPEKFDTAAQGIFQEWWKDASDGTFYRSLSVEKARAAFDKLASHPNITRYDNARLIEVIKSGSTIISIGIALLCTMNVKIHAKQFVDGSADADFAVKAGAEYTIGQGDIGAPERWQPPSLEFKVGNVDWETWRTVSGNAGVADPTIGDSSHYGGFRNKIEHEFSLNTDLEHEPNTFVRNPNMCKPAGQEWVFINALLIWGVNPLDQCSYDEGYARGKREAQNFINWAKEIDPSTGKANLPGFENAYVPDDWAPELYVRETRHIKTDYMLTGEDALMSNWYSDAIAQGSYGLDVQAHDRNEALSSAYTEVKGFDHSHYGRPWDYGNDNPASYSIPMSTILPVGLDNLTVAGRSSGYTTIAMSSARVIPTGMSVAEAAGALATFAIEQKMNPRQVHRDTAMREAYLKDLVQFNQPYYHVIYGNPHNITGWTDIPSYSSKVPHGVDSEWWFDCWLNAYNSGVVFPYYGNPENPRDPNWFGHTSEDYITSAEVAYMVKESIYRYARDEWRRSEVQSRLERLSTDTSDKVGRNGATRAMLMPIMTTPPPDGEAWGKAEQMCLLSPEALANMPEERLLIKAEAAHLIGWYIKMLKAGCIAFE